MLVECSIENSDVYRQEYFGPMAFIIPCPSAQDGLMQATKDAQECGSISNYAYSQHPEFLNRIEDAFFDAGTSVGCNLITHLPINFAAAYSDYHVTGLNPAGNACLTDLAFVTARFRIVQIKREQ